MPSVTEEITIKVDKETANAYKSSPAEEQRIIPLLLKLLDLLVEQLQSLITQN